MTKVSLVAPNSSPILQKARIESVTEKTARIAGNAFDKAKASRSYGFFETIKYSVIFPLMQMVMKLEDQGVKNLNYYRTHIALCSEIETVKSAYKTFIAASSKALANPAPAAESARHKALAAGEALANKYNKLIELAAKQASDIGVNKTVYLDDLHLILDKETQGLILSTLNGLRPRMAIEKGLLGKKEGLELNFRMQYRTFVTEFISNIQECHRKPGDELAITEAFIQGLAAIPELGGSNKLLLDLYDDLDSKQLSSKDDQNLVIRHFKEQIEALMNGPNSITTEDLQNIHYKGVSFVPPSGFPSIDRLNEFKKARSDLQVLQGQIQKTEEEIAETQQVVAERKAYSFNDVEAFMKELSIDNDKLKGISKDRPALGDFAQSYTAARNTQALIADRITKIKAKQKVPDIDKSREIANKQREINATKESVKQQNEMKESYKLMGLEPNIGELTDESKLARLEAEKTYLIEGDLKVLENELEASRTHTIARLSGEEIDALARDLGVGRLPNASQSSIAQKLKEVRAAKSEIKLLAGASLQLQGTDKAIQDEIKAKMKAETPSLILNDQAFVLNSAMYSDLEKAEIATQLESNFIMAKKVTIAVGREMVKQGNAPQLGNELDTREGKEINKKGLNELVKEKFQTFIAPFPLERAVKKEPTVSVRAFEENSGESVGLLSDCDEAEEADILS